MPARPLGESNVLSAGLLAIHQQHRLYRCARQQPFPGNVSAVGGSLELMYHPTAARRNQL